MVGVIAHYGEHVGENEEYSRGLGCKKRWEERTGSPLVHYITGTPGGSQTPKHSLFIFTFHALCDQGCQWEEFISSFHVLSRLSDRWESTPNKESKPFIMTVIVMWFLSISILISSRMPDCGVPPQYFIHPVPACKPSSSSFSRWAFSWRARAASEGMRAWVVEWEGSQVSVDSFLCWLDVSHMGILCNTVPETQ